MRRHDLLQVDPLIWQAMLEAHPNLDALPLVGDWASNGWPVIVRRRMAGDVIDGLPAALPLPPCHGKQRVGFRLAPDKGLVALPPVLLRDAAAAAPAAWQPVIAALQALGDKTGAVPRVFGALLWQHITGLPYLSASSDLDLLWAVDSESAATALIAGLVRLDAASPVRLDGELELPDGGGVNWREWAQADDGVLVKTMDGITARRISGLFPLATP